jgi:drug/metabolite transporter (DMT)-like permease
LRAAEELPEVIMPARTLAIIFAVATACFWGLYGPALGNARSTQKPPEWSAYKPYVFIGIAYLVWGCLGGMAAMKYFGDTFSFSGPQQRAATWGFLAGSLGAFGALTLTFAMMKAQGNAGLVMPIVFGGAVTVTALTTIVVARGHVTASPLLWVGMLLVVSGIILVAKYTPHAAPGHKPGAAPSHTTQTPAVSAPATHETHS